MIESLCGAVVTCKPVVFNAGRAANPDRAKLERQPEPNFDWGDLAGFEQSE